MSKIGMHGVQRRHIVTQRYLNELFNKITQFIEEVCQNIF